MWGSSAFFWFFNDPEGIVAAVGVVAEDEVERVPIRRMRRAPVITEGRNRLFHSRFRLDLETGIGLTSGQGSDPQIMLRWSDDGGHTWTGEHWVSAGKIGQYKHRAVWNRLGSARNRVYEVTVSDPVKIVLIDAVVDIEKGRS